jgi:hypothetical protein
MADNRSYEMLTKDRQYWRVVEPTYNHPGLSLAGLAQERRNGQHDTSRTFRHRLRTVAKNGERERVSPYTPSILYFGW